MQPFDAILIGFVVAFTLVCLVTDLRWRRIPNWLTVPVFALGLVVHTIGGGLPGLWFSLRGFATGFGVLLALWLIGGGGGGDVKMMGALGAWLGAWLTVLVFLASALVTLALLAGLMAYTTANQGFAAARRRYSGKAIAEANLERSQPTPQRAKVDKKHREKRTGKPTRRGRVVPYAVPMAISTWIVLALARSGGAVFGW